MRSLFFSMLLFLLGLSTAVMAGEDEVSPKLVHVRLEGILTEKPQEDGFGFSGTKITSLWEVLDLLDRAGKDPEVAGVALTLGDIPMGLGQIEEIRRSLKNLADSGKKVFVHVEDLDTRTYALFSSVSDLSMVPSSTLWLTGLYGQGIYLKEILDTLGIQADFLHMGGYKSAAETFTRTGPSDEAEENMNWLLDSLYQSLVSLISESREMEEEKIRDLIDRGIFSAEEALGEGLVSHVEYRDEFLERVRKELGEGVRIENHYTEGEEPEIDLSNPFAFFTFLAKQLESSTESHGNAIGLVYVEGPILPGFEEPNPFGPSDVAFGGDIRDALEKAGDDDSVKAVVLRVDSPGGSALASEIVWRAVERLKEKKPVVVSMGNMAASGGYYVSCGANRIFADRTTLTGSIGVVGGKMMTTQLWEKIGVDWHEYKRGKNSDLMSSLRGWTGPQRELFRRMLQSVYERFTGHVEEGRADKLAKPIEEIAGGRVFTGAQAAELGLVDEIGGLSDAVLAAANLASVTDYQVRVIPPPVSPFVELMEEMSGHGDRASDLRFPSSAETSMGFSLLKTLDPDLLAAVKTALVRLELISREGVVLMPSSDFVIR